MTAVVPLPHPVKLAKQRHKTGITTVFMLAYCNEAKSARVEAKRILE